MSSDYFKILQMNEENSKNLLEQAYQMSRLRYERLTRSGPLQHYRAGLLQDAQRAYEGLKKQEPLAGSPWAGGERPGGSNGSRNEKGKAPGAEIDREDPTRTIQTTHRRDSAHKETVRSAIRNRADRQGYSGGFSKPAIRSELKDYRTYFDGTGNPGDGGSDQNREDGSEDRFCREVLYRLEGDLIRFSSREELLEMAKQWEIGQFRANLLMAQIVESVRHYGLYQPNRAERKQLAMFRKYRQNTEPLVFCKRNRLWWWIGAGAILVAGVLDALLVKRLG